MCVCVDYTSVQGHLWCGCYWINGLRSASVSLDPWAHYSSSEFEAWYVLVPFGVYCLRTFVPYLTWGFGMVYGFFVWTFEVSFVGELFWEFCAQILYVVRLSFEYVSTFTKCNFVFNDKITDFFGGIYVCVWTWNMP